jgi:putative peptide zinc metalloprotease protein
MTAAVAGARPQSSPPQLPLLREDLVLSEGPLSTSGEVTWRIYDPLRHRFIAIDAPTRRALELWPAHETAASLSKGLAEQMGQPFNTGDVDGLVAFLRQHGLLQDATEGDWRRRWAAEQAQRHGVVMRLVHNYLFFRVPLFAPEKFLRASGPLVAPLFWRWVQLSIAAIGIVGLFLVSRQWDSFITDARALLTGAGLAQFGATLFFVKILHEFGHAYTAVRHGCRVPVIGVAFMMMAPVLYTDVTDAWRLKDWRHRLAIDSAGVAVELGIACFATLIWVFLPEGSARHMAFLLATTSWTMSIAVNLNPFMRFDGYYIASDLVGVENLQSRAFDLGLWKLRELLFNLRRPSPETELPNARVRLLIAYAWGIWCYRLVLFTGIAVTVYAYFFKALGICLFLFEIGYFIAKPLTAELLEWWRMRRDVLRSTRTLLSVTLSILTVLFVAVPWSTDVQAPAVLEAAETARIYAPRSAQVRDVTASRDQTVKTGDVLVRLESPDLENERRLVLSRLTAVELRLARASADKDDRDDRQVLSSTRISLVAKLAGIDRERGELVVRAPINGTICELDPAIHKGRWIGVHDQLALVCGTAALSVSGYLREADLWRVTTGAGARFIPEMPLASSVDAVLTRVSLASALQIDTVELVVPNGGSIEVQSDGRPGKLTPTAAHYLVTLDARSSDTRPSTRMRGIVHIQGQAESFIAAAWRHILKVLIRESAA